MMNYKILPSTLTEEPWPTHGGDRTEGYTSCCPLLSHFSIMMSGLTSLLVTSADPALVQDPGRPQSQVTPDFLTPARETQPQVTSEVNSTV